MTQPRVPPEELPPLEPPAAEVRNTIEEILARPVFDEPPRPLLERLADFVLDQLGRALALLTGGGRGALVAWLILGVLVLVVAAIVTRLVATIRRDRRARSQGDEQRAAAGTDWAAAAGRYEAQGEWREALRCRWRALVDALAARRVVDDIDGRTAGEYRMEVSLRAPAAAASFSEATDAFETTWYGGRDVGPGDVARIRELADDAVGAV